MAIDELEFRRILELFPIVRSRDYYLDVESSGQSTSGSTGNKEVTKGQDGDRKDRDSHPVDNHDAFWDKLKLAAEKKTKVLVCSRYYWPRVAQKLEQETLEKYPT